MATVTIKQTPLILKNGKLGAILEENQYEFCPEIWDYIKSYMGFVSEEQFKYDKWFKSAVIHCQLKCFKDGGYAEQTIKKNRKTQWDFDIIDLRKKNLCKKEFINFFEKVKKQIKEKDYRYIRLYAVYNYVEPYYDNERTQIKIENKIENNIQLYFDLLNVKF